MLAQNKQTKIYDGVYIDKEGKRQKCRVRVSPRLAALALSITLFTTGCSSMTNKVVNDDSTLDSESYIVNDIDLQVIEDIINKRGNLLSSSYVYDYTVTYGDTLSSIALSNGTTIDNLCKLNNIDSKDIIRVGDVLKVEKEESLDELPAEIVLAENYMEYVFNSKSGKLARGELEVTSQEANLYKSILYGNGDASEVDSKSIYGTFISSYVAFHENETDVNKEAYLDVLMELIDDVTKNNILGLTSYETFKIYIKNGTTEYTEEIKGNKTVYDK